MKIDIDNLLLLLRMNQNHRREYLLSLAKEHKEFMVILNLAALRVNCKVVPTKSSDKSDETIILKNILKVIAHNSGYPVALPKALSDAERLMIRFISKSEVLRILPEELTSYKTENSVHGVLAEYTDFPLTKISESYKERCEACGTRYEKLTGNLCNTCKDKVRQWCTGRSYEFVVTKNYLNFPNGFSDTSGDISYVYKHWTIENTTSSLIIKPIGHPRSPLLDEPLEFEEFIVSVS